VVARVSGPRWGAVIVNYEGGPALVDAARSILADTSAGVPEVVVIDNGSQDGSVARLRKDVPEVTVIEPGSNRGYASAANLGIGATTAPVVAVCNCDVVLEPGVAAAALSRFDAEPDVGAVGPLVRNPDGSRYPSARAIPRLVDAVGHGIFGLAAPNNRFTRRYRELDADPAQPRDVGFVSGAAIWLRRDALRAVGGWDDGYFMYVEDVDLCWRLRAAGWRVVYEPGGEVVHVQGASTVLHPYRMLLAHHRSLFRFAAKRWRGGRRILLVPAAGYLGVRALITMAAHAIRPRRQRRRIGGSSG
jgi:N-acetylglucosaminyl-diphospho-decaprenol L-rhamnosyltransferase